jgi:transcriptional regulator with XRE-family HTH domain
MWRGCIIPAMAKLTRLKDVRQRKALTQQQLAEKAGVNRVTIARIEGGKDEPFPTTLRKVAEALGVEPEELLEPTAPLPIRVAVAQRELPPLDPRITVVDADDVARLLHAEPDLVPLINEAAVHLASYFPDVVLHLRYAVDPESGEPEELVLGASSSLDVQAELAALNSFDRAWWIHNARRARGLLLVTLE